MDLEKTIRTLEDQLNFLKMCLKNEFHFSNLKKATIKYYEEKEELEKEKEELNKKISNYEKKYK